MMPDFRAYEFNSLVDRKPQRFFQMQGFAEQTFCPIISGSGFRNVFEYSRVLLSPVQRLGSWTGTRELFYRIYDAPLALGSLKDPNQRPVFSPWNGK